MRETLPRARRGGRGCSPVGIPIIMIAMFVFLFQ
jgi:hypothetical protein